MNRLLSIIFLFLFTFFLFFITSPLHELVHIAVDSVPGGGVTPVALNFFNERAYSAFSIASVSVMVYDPVAAQTTFIVGEILGFLLQFAIAILILWKFILPSRWFSHVLEQKKGGKNEAEKGESRFA